ncbi:DUF3325 domain-containing protein [Uliginosibacterium sp. 31-16]|uniref:DUF3325 domain-containing protein n=1 Tax=Uliginosibacterium sp. 31-16 TaxID=3068315 RepID=UPI00274002A2|nr:DUF3325 domain-containing protein [Uliginosibacterium sp. 31-16]MDP5239272.1 DUF3325 domain-containing protein [Uliginosibacterium sp. 31-16]
MPESLWLIIAAVLSLTGMTWLALAMHWDQVMPRPASRADAPRRTLRGFGTVMLAASAVASMLADRPSMAVLVWFMLLAASALTVALALAWRPALLRVLCPLRAH